MVLANPNSYGPPSGPTSLDVSMYVAQHAPMYSPFMQQPTMYAIQSPSPAYGIQIGTNNTRQAWTPGGQMIFY